MNQNELNQRFMVFEQQIRQIQEQLTAVDQAILDMSSIKLGLDEIRGKTGEEIMAPVGRGIFVKAKLVSEDLTIDVGGKNFVVKSIEDGQKLIDEQLVKLKEIKVELENDLEKINEEITEVMLEHQKEQKV